MDQQAFEKSNFIAKSVVTNIDKFFAAKNKNKNTL